MIGDDGLVLTIGYLITEAQTIWITDHRGRSVPGHALGVDFASGLGLVLPAMPLDAPALTRGGSADAAIGDDLLMLAHGCIGHSLATRLDERKTFAGYWEYVLDEALYTSPADPSWSGGAVVDIIGARTRLGEHRGTFSGHHLHILIGEATNGRFGDLYVVGHGE